MADLIDRQGALDAFNGDLTIQAAHNAGRVYRYLKMVTDRIKALPAVQPKRGEWIKMHWKAFRCSVCKRVSEYSTNFCPNCGADMRGEAYVDRI